MLSKDLLNQVVAHIVQHQISIVGPLALEQANKTNGIKIEDAANFKVAISNNDSNKVLTELVQKYEQLFGQASIEVCKDAIKEIHPQIPDEELPEILR